MTLGELGVDPCNATKCGHRSRTICRCQTRYTLAMVDLPSKSNVPSVAQHVAQGCAGQVASMELQWPWSET